MQTAHRQVYSPVPRPRLSVLNLGEILHQPYNCVCCFRQCVLLSDTYAWSAVEGQITPSGTQFLPAIWVEFIRVRAVNILTSVHAKDAVCYHAPLWNKDGRFAVRPTTKRENGILGGEATVRWNRWVETKRFIENLSAFSILAT